MISLSAIAAPLLAAVLTAVPALGPLLSRLPALPPTSTIFRGVSDAVGMIVLTQFDGSFWMPVRASTSASTVDGLFHFIFWLSFFFSQKRICDPRLNRCNRSIPRTARRNGAPSGHMGSRLTHSPRNRVVTLSW